MKISGTKSKCFHLPIFMNHNCVYRTLFLGIPSTITVIEFKIRNHLSSKSFPLWKRSTQRKVIIKLFQKQKTLLETMVGRWKKKLNDQIEWVVGQFFFTVVEVQTHMIYTYSIHLYRNQVVQGHPLTFELIIWIPKESTSSHW